LALTSDQNQTFVLNGLNELIELLGQNKVESNGDYAAV
jgi:hypothetical protein